LKTFIVWALTVAGIVVGVHTAFQFAYPTTSIRYRLTLEATVGDRPVAGSGVIQVDYWASPALLPDMKRVEAHVSGEAVMLDLGDHGLVFALLADGFHRRPSASEMVPQNWNLSLQNRSDVLALRSVNGAKELRSGELPGLVRFRRLNDPATVEHVEPTDLATTFGSDVRLVRGVVEITDAPITVGIRQRLSWLAAQEHQTSVRATIIGELLAYSNYKQGSK
jgi:hypothetical protein